MLANKALKKRLIHENHDLEARIKSYEQERTAFEEQRAEWKDELTREKEDIVEQKDRLTVLSHKLSGTKVHQCVCVCMYVLVCNLVLKVGWGEGAKILRSHQSVLTFFVHNGIANYKTF